MNPSGVDPSLSPEPVLIFGDIETEARGVAYGAMVFDVRPGCSTERHNHGSEENWFVREGTGRAVIGDQEIDVAAGSRLTMPPGVPHQVFNTSTDQNLQVVAFWWRETGNGK